VFAYTCSPEVPYARYFSLILSFTNISSINSEFADKELPVTKKLACPIIKSVQTKQTGMSVLLFELIEVPLNQKLFIKEATFI